MDLNFKKLLKKYEKESISSLQEWIKINSIYDENTVSVDKPFGEGVASALEYIARLGEENGFNVSGGQKQRIILARALLKPFNILIIDEGLNELDIALERKILKNIFNYFKNKTIIIVSHRLENKDLFDKIINLDLCMT